MMNGRHQPKQFAETMKDTCNYCHRTPALWRHVGSEKICSHCGTRVFSSAVSPSGSLYAKSPNR